MSSHERGRGGYRPSHKEERQNSRSRNRGNERYTKDPVRADELMSKREYDTKDPVRAEDLMRNMIQTLKETEDLLKEKTEELKDKNSEIEIICDELEEKKQEIEGLEEVCEEIETQFNAYKLAKQAEINASKVESLDWLMALKKENKQLKKENKELKQKLANKLTIN